VIWKTAILILIFAQNESQPHYEVDVNWYWPTHGTPCQAAAGEKQLSNLSASL